MFSDTDWGISDVDDDVRAPEGYDCEGPDILAILHRQECRNSTTFQFMLNAGDRLSQKHFWSCLKMILLLTISSDDSFPDFSITSVSESSLSFGDNRDVIH